MDPSEEGSYASFSRTSGYYEIKFMARELYYSQRANREVENGLGWQEGERFSVEKNRTRAMVEAAALELNYPQLTLVPMFPSLYRYLRTEELNGALTRGGTTLLVGSGTTLYEALALSVEQPTQQKVEEVFAEFGPKINSIHRRRKEIAMDPTQVERTPLLPHAILAYEPDKRQTEGFNKANGFFQTNTQIVSGPVRLEDQRFHNVVLNRVDPAIFQTDQLLLRSLMNSVEAGGAFVVTIGTGNNPEELAQRKQFLEQVAEALPNAGMRLSSRLPRIMHGPDRKMYGPEMAGGLIGRKNEI